MSDDTQPARANVGPGDKVAGYLLEEQIGQGGMAVVYRAYDERLDRRVALKVLAPSLAADNAFRTRFIRESRAAATVEHPNIIPVYDAGDAGGCLFISMRYVQGGDVRSLLADGKGLPPARAWNIINQVGSALDMAHSHNLVHRDVKPANMLIDASAKTLPGRGGDPPQPPALQRDVNTSGPVTEHIYLSDFGISKQTVASNLTSTGQFVGTLDYIAPEQIEGQAIDGRADQYSLACAAFELLCGVPPFTGPNIFALINSHLSEQPPLVSKLQPGLPASVDRVLDKAMDKAPARRYATCAQFAADLGRALGLVPGPLEADSGQPAGPAAGTAGPAKPHQATELAGPAVAAAAACCGRRALRGRCRRRCCGRGWCRPDRAGNAGNPWSGRDGKPWRGARGRRGTGDDRPADDDRGPERSGRAGSAGQRPAGLDRPAVAGQRGSSRRRQVSSGSSRRRLVSSGRASNGRRVQDLVSPVPTGSSKTHRFRRILSRAARSDRRRQACRTTSRRSQRSARADTLIGGLVAALVVAAAAAAVAVTVLNHGGNNGNRPVRVIVVRTARLVDPGRRSPDPGGRHEQPVVSDDAVAPYAADDCARHRGNARACRRARCPAMSQRSRRRLTSVCRVQPGTGADGHALRTEPREGEPHGRAFLLTPNR